MCVAAHCRVVEGEGGGKLRGEKKHALLLVQVHLSTAASLLYVPPFRLFFGRPFSFFLTVL
jgi:hypothetical protein